FDVTVGIDHLNMEEVRIEIFRGTPLPTPGCPGGARPAFIPPLLAHQLDPDPRINRPANTGITGQHLGMVRDRPNLTYVGTTFHDKAPRLVTDPIGDQWRRASHWRPAPDTGASPLPGFNLTADQINAQPIVLRVWDMRFSGNMPPPAQSVTGWTIRFTGKLTVPAADVLAATGILAIHAANP